jgi:hypothetical protein
MLAPAAAPDWLNWGSCKLRQMIRCPHHRLPRAIRSDFDSYLPKMGLKAALCRGKTWIVRFRSANIAAVLP